MQDKKPHVKNQGGAQPRPSKSALTSPSNGVGAAGSDRQALGTPHQTGTPGRKTFPKLSN